MALAESYTIDFAVPRERPLLMISLPRFSFALIVAFAVMAASNAAAQTPAPAAVNQPARAPPQRGQSRTKVIGCFPSEESCLTLGCGGASGYRVKRNALFVSGCAMLVA